MALTEDKLAMTLGALELGVIPPGQSIDEALASLAPAEARKAKRKFRKIWRQKRRSFGGLGSEVRGIRRDIVTIECRRVGKKSIDSR